MNRGWVYIISNPAMPGIIKVGYSTKHPHNRAKELKTTGIPTEYEVIFSVIVDRPRDLEQRVHNHLREYKKGGEWFTCSLAAATAAIKELYTGTYYTDEDYKNVNTVELALENERLRKIAEEKFTFERAKAAFIEKNTAARAISDKINKKYKKAVEESRRPFLDSIINNKKLNSLLGQQNKEIEMMIEPIYGKIYFVCSSCKHKGIYKPNWLDACHMALHSFHCPHCNSYISKISFEGWDIPPFFNAFLFTFTTNPSSW